MTRKLKALGLAIVAALAVSVLASSAGQAEEGKAFTAGAYPASLHAGASTHSYNIPGGRKFECSTTFSGELTGASTGVKLKPTYSECTGSLGGVKKPAKTVAFCEEGLKHTTFIVLTETECAKNYIHIITVYNDAEETEVLCEYELAETEGSVSHKNLGGTSGVETTWNVSGIPYERTAGSVLICGPEESTATYTGTSVITATNGGKATSLDVG